MGELTREERDRFERLQVEVEGLRRAMKVADDEERPREHANMLKAEQLRDDLQQAVRARDESLHELRDRVSWLEKDASNPRRREPSVAISLIGFIFKVAVVGLGGAVLACMGLMRLFGADH